MDAEDEELDWRALTNARVRDSWALRPTELVWLDDKLLQGSHTAQLLGENEPLHVPILLALDASAPEQPTRQSAWARVLGRWTR